MVFLGPQSEQVSLAYCVCIGEEYYKPLITNYNVMKRILLLFTCVIFTFCTKEEVPSIELLTQELSFEKEGGTQILSFNCNKHWTATASGDWITLSLESGDESVTTLKVSCSSNDDYEYDRYGYVTITVDGGVEAQCSISQNHNTGILINNTLYELSKNRQKIEVVLQANVDFSIATTVDWITNLNTKSMSSKLLMFQIDENVSYDNREGEIIITDNENNKSYTIKVQQSQSDVVLLEDIEYNVNYACQTLSIVIKSNVEYSFTTNSDWLKLSSESTKALSSSTILAEIPENQNNWERTAIIVVTQTGTSNTQQIKITQDARPDVSYYPVGPFIISYIENNVEISISSETELTISEKKEDSWIKATLNEKNRNDRWIDYDLSISATDNSGNERRSLIALVSDCDVKLAEFEIIQQGMADEVCIYLDGTRSLENSLSDYDVTTINSLKINGKMTELDELYLKKLNHLYSLDISGTDIKIIAKSYFSDFRNLEKMVLPDYLEELSERAFNNCSKLRHISIPSSVKILGNNVFEYCKNLQSVQFDDESILDRIPDYAFGGCKSLQKIKLPNSIVSIGRGAFNNCSSLYELLLNNKLKEIESPQLFYYDSRTVPHLVELTTSGAFSNCTSLTSVQIPSSVETIGAGAFYNCTSLKNVDFSNATSLKRIIGAIRTTFSPNESSNSVIVFGAFANCPAIEAVALPSNLEELGAGAFWKCSSLKSISFGNDSKLTKIVSGVEIEKNYGLRLVETYSPFAYTSIESIVIPKNITAINGGMFYHCSKLESISFDKGSLLEYITGEPYDYNMDFCDFYYAFTRTNLKLFDASNCNNIKICSGIDGSGIEIFKIGTIEPPTLSFVDLASYSILYVPSESINEYSNSRWNCFSTIKAL